MPNFLILFYIVNSQLGVVAKAILLKVHNTKSVNIKKKNKKLIWTFGHSFANEI